MECALRGRLSLLPAAHPASGFAVNVMLGPSLSCRSASVELTPFQRTTNYDRYTRE
jgi:hypothetical protein